MQLRFDAGAKQRFIGVDVANPHHHGAIYEGEFDRDAARARGLIQQARIEIRGEWLGP